MSAGMMPDRLASKASAQRYLPCLAQLRGLLPNLADAEHRAAEWILAHPDETLVLSINDVSRQAGVGVGTVVRLCARLGYAKFSDLRIALAVELLNPHYGTPEQVSEGDDASTVIHKIATYGMQVLSDTAALLDPAEMERAAVAIAQAQRIAFYARGGYSTQMATLAQARFLVLDLMAAAYTGEWDQSASARLLGPGDVAVGLSYTGEAKEVIEALSIATANGATTVCITNTPQSPITGAAQISLLVSFPEGWSWGHPALSRIGMLAAIDALYAAALLLKLRTANTDPIQSRPAPASFAADGRGGRVVQQSKVTEDVLIPPDTFTRRSVIYRDGTTAPGATSADRNGGTLAQALPRRRQEIPATTIEYWHVNTQTFSGPTNNELFQRFTELNPGLAVSGRYHQNSYTGLMENLLTSIAAGNPPDVAQIGYLYLDYAAGNVPYAPIEDLVATYGPSDFLAAFPENVLDLGRVGEKVAGMPFAISNPVTYFNADLLRQAGLDPIAPPRTWNDWTEAARAIKDATGKAGISLEFYPGGNWLVQALIESNGGRLLKCQDGELRAAFDQPEAIAAVQLWADLIAEGLSLFVHGDQAGAAFLSGESATFILSIGDRNGLQTQASFKLGATSFPRFGEQELRLPVGGNALFVLAQEPARQEAAWKFIQFLESPQSLTTWTKGTGYIPPRGDIADDLAYLGDFLQANPMQAVAMAQTPYAVSWASFPGPNGLQAGKVLSAAVEEALTGRRSAEEALTAAAQEVNELIGGQPCA